jgi:hypothetical protein
VEHRSVLEAQLAEESRGRIGQRPILPQQQSTLPSAFPSRPPLSVLNTPSCFCIGEHTCLSSASPSSAMSMTYGNFQIPTTEPQADLPDDTHDLSWMGYLNTNSGAISDVEH